MQSKNDGKNKVVLVTLVLVPLSFSVASSIATIAPRSASAQGVVGQSGGNATNATMTNAGNAITGEGRTIVMMPTEQTNGTYRWSMNNTINPTLILTPNVNNTITVDNPTDEVHALVIAMVQGGREVATTGDVQPNSHAQLTIMPNATDSLRYYCSHHPETMLGDIRVINETTAVTNATSATSSTSATGPSGGNSASPY